MLTEIIVPYCIAGFVLLSRYDSPRNLTIEKTRQVEALSSALSFFPELEGASGDTLDQKTFVIKSNRKRFPLARCGALEIQIRIGPDMNMPLWRLGFEAGNWFSK